MNEILAFLARNDLDGYRGGPSLVWATLAGIAFLLAFLSFMWMLGRVFSNRTTVIQESEPEP